MFPVQIGIRRNHFRFKPDTELHAKLIYFIYQILQSARQLFFIYHPVTKCTVIIEAVAKPAIIHNQHLNSKLRSLLCNRNQLLGIKFKISSFPVINKNRALLVLIFSADQMIAVEIMEGSGHCAKSARRIYHNYFRSLKGFARIQLPAKVLRMNSHDHTKLVKLIVLYHSLKVTGIYEIHCINFTVIVIGTLCL